MVIDEFSGKLKWDEGDLPYGGILTLENGRTAAFEIDGDETDEWFPEAARNALKFLLENESLIRHKIAVALRKLYTETWLYEHTITPEELAQKINLNNVQMLTDGSAGLYYTVDDDLFAGHWVQVPIDASGEIGEPDIEG